MGRIPLGWREQNHLQSKPDCLQNRNERDGHNISTRGAQKKMGKVKPLGEKCETVQEEDERDYKMGTFSSYSWGGQGEIASLRKNSA